MLFYAVSFLKLPPNGGASSIVVISLILFKKGLYFFQIGSVTIALNLQLPIYANYLNKRKFRQSGFSPLYKQDATNKPAAPECSLFW